MKLTFSGINRIFLLVLCLIFSSTASAQKFGFKVSPGLTRNDADKIVPQLNLGLSLHHLGHKPLENFPRSFFFQGKADATFMRHASENPENHELALSAGIDISLKKVAEVDLSDPDAVDDAEPLEFDYGAIGFAASGKYEASQDWDEQGLNFGGEVRYTPPAWWPSFIINFAAIVPLKSELRDLVGVNLDAISRLDASAYWITPRIKDKVSFTFHLRAFRAFSLSKPLKEAFQDGLFFRSGIIYHLNKNLKIVHWDNFFIKGALGQLPTESDDHKAVTIGVELSPGS